MRALFWDLLKGLGLRVQGLRANFILTPGILPALAPFEAKESAFTCLVQGHLYAAPGVTGMVVSRHSASFFDFFACIELLEERACMQKADSIIEIPCVFNIGDIKSRNVLSHRPLQQPRQSGNAPNQSQENARAEVRRTLCNMRDSKP